MILMTPEMAASLLLGEDAISQARSTARALGSKNLFVKLPVLALLALAGMQHAVVTETKFFGGDE